MHLESQYGKITKAAKDRRNDRPTDSEEEGYIQELPDSPRL
jgi:hypothetical protein